MMLYVGRDTVKTGEVKAAPPQQSLKLFGGKLTIEEFRERSANLKLEHLERKFIARDVTKLSNGFGVTVKLATVDWI
jgi:hypothetical protein